LDIWQFVAHEKVLTGVTAVFMSVIIFFQYHDWI